MNIDTWILISLVILLTGVIIYLAKHHNQKRAKNYHESLPIRAQSLDMNVIDIKEIRRYQASWGDWYVQVVVDDRLIELRFLMEPNEAQVYETVTSSVEAEKLALVILEAEDGENV